MTPSTHVPRRFRIVADEDPLILTRLLGLISTVNVCPSSFHCQRVCTAQLEMDCTIDTLNEAQWHFLLRKLSQPPEVWLVEDLSISMALSATG